MPAMGRHFEVLRETAQRIDEIATLAPDAPLAQDAGTTRGSDIAQAATIVARSTRLVHMIASSRMGND
jgi:hypothetical protein